MSCLVRYRRKKVRWFSESLYIEWIVRVFLELGKNVYIVILMIILNKDLVINVLKLYWERRVILCEIMYIN